MERSTGGSPLKKQRACEKLDKAWKRGELFIPTNEDERQKWWRDKLDDLVRRANKGEKNLDLAAAMCVGASTALMDEIKAQEGRAEGGR